MMKPILRRTFFGLLAGTAAPTSAMTWHPGKKEAPESEPSGPMKRIVTIHYTPLRVFGGGGILLTGGKWVLTARHSVEKWSKNNLTCKLVKSVGVKQKILHPDSGTDLALVKLTSPLPEPEDNLELLSRDLEVGEPLWLGGYGSGGPKGGARTSSKFAAGKNRLLSVNGHRGSIAFDAPDSKHAIEGEIYPGLFDSGSPVFAKDAKQWKLAGITITSSRSKDPAYGSKSSHELIAPVRKWIDEVIQKS